MKKMMLFVSTAQHPIKAYDLDEVLKHAERDPEGFNRFDEEWGHSLNIIEALKNDWPCEFQEV